MRSYGRIWNSQGTPRWVVIVTDAQGFNDFVWATTLIQSFKLNINESPFYANYGIAAQQSVITQVFPDYYVNNLQQLFSGYFASLVVTKVTSPTPTYNVVVTTQQGVVLQYNILDNTYYNEYAVTDTGQQGVTDTGQQVIVG